MLQRFLNRTTFVTHLKPLLDEVINLLHIFYWIASIVHYCFREANLCVDVLAMVTMLLFIAFWLMLIVIFDNNKKMAQALSFSLFLITYFFCARHNLILVFHYLVLSLDRDRFKRKRMKITTSKCDLS
jgi:hypothetical protein